MIEDNKFITDDRICIRKITENLHNIVKVADEKKIDLSESDYNDIDEIIQCLQDLEKQRFEAHHVWEIESIKFEALRHKLTHYPDQITNEIQKAVSAARGLNEQTINELKYTLNDINSSIDTNTNDLDRLNLENESLIPRLKEMKINHEEIVVIMNQHLAVKADRQIDLNQIRDKIKKNNEKIVELEEDVFLLKQTMIKERATAREEKKRLVQETNTTQEKLNVQTLKNDELNKVYLNLKHEATETTMAVDEKSATLRQYVKAIGELKKRQDELDRTIEETKWSNELLKEDIKQIEEKSVQSKYDFENCKDQLGEEISMFNDSVKNQRLIQFELLSVKEQSADELERIQKTKDEVSLNMRSIMEKLKHIEEDSAAKAGDVGQLGFEMEEMERSIIEGKEMHEATVMSIKSQVASFKKQLEKERKERIEVQKDNSDIQEQINQFRTEHVKFMRDINAKINESKSENSRLQSQYQQLTRQIKEEVTQSANLKRSITEYGEMLQREQTEFTDKISKLTKDIFEMEKEESDIKRRLEENEPSLQELQIYFDKHLKDYEKLKKDLVGLKSRKNALDDSIERAKRSIAKESIDLDKLKSQKQLNEEQLDTQIESESTKRSEVEKEIYVLGCKTSTVKEEIAHLDKLIKEMDNRARLLRDNWEKAIHVSSRIKQDLGGQKSTLRKGWSDDLKLELEFKNRELEEITKLQDLLQATEERGTLVSTVSDKLYSEIKSFEQFLSNMATLSPSMDSEANKGTTEIFERIDELTNIVNTLGHKLAKQRN